MDYEKKYKEALERFKTFREKYCTYGDLHFGDVIFDKTGEAQKDLDAIFPELVESEDERIRKDIIEYLKLVGKGDGDYAQPIIDRWIAYLEKQKEPKQESGEKGVKGPQEIGDWRGDEGVCKKQKEPAEWSEEDTEMYINVASSLRGYACGLENEEHKRHIKKELDWLENRFKSLRTSWKPSEDEERLINTSISFLKDFADKGYENAVECIDWLKSKLNGNTCKQNESGSESHYPEHA